MSMELVLSRLLGPADTGGVDHGALSPEQRHALAQRLRTLVSEGADPVHDRGLEAHALQLAGYLDGAMSPAERADFERALLRSPQRRDELLGSVAWLDELAARREAPSADATALALALDTRPATPPVQRRGLAAFIEAMLPRRFAIASALATALIAVGVTNVALQLGLPAAMPAGHIEWVSTATDGPIQSLQAAGQSARILLTAETINALAAYQARSDAPQRQELLRTLRRIGGSSFDTRKVQAVVLQPRLLQYLRDRTGPLPTRLAADLGVDGTLTLDRAD